MYKPLTQRICRQLSSSVSKNTSWGRVALRIKATTNKDNAIEEDKYINQAKEKTSSSEENILKLQEEVQEEMAAALSRTGAKLENAYREMVHARYEFELYSKQQGTSRCKSILKEKAEIFNSTRKTAEIARWELLIHRQALGFIHKNHLIVNEAYPIPKPITDDDLHRI